MTQLEKWQPKRKVSTALNRKAREGYMNIGHHSGRQNLAHGVIEQMEKGDIEMSTNEQARLNNVAAQLEKAVMSLQKVADGDLFIQNGRSKEQQMAGLDAQTKDYKGPSFKERQTAEMVGLTEPEITTGGKRHARKMEKAMISLQKVADGDLFIQKRGPVDRLTGGRVKFENKPEKQYNPKGVDWTGRELQVRGPNTKLMRGAAAALGAKKTVTPSNEADRTKRATEAAGLDYAAKMDTGKPAMKMTRTMKMGAVPVEKGLKAYAGRVKQRFNAASAAKKRTESYNEKRKTGTLGLTGVKEYDAMKMGAGYKKLAKSADGDCGCSD